MRADSRAPTTASRTRPELTRQKQIDSPNPASLPGRIERLQYKEAGPQLLLQAFLQRIVNDGGRIDREYGLGRRRTDLLLQWPLDETQGFLGPMQRVVLELKLLHKLLDATLREGLEQTADYLDRAGTVDGHLLIFDRRPGVAWEEEIFQRLESYGPYSIRVWGM